MLPGQTAAQRRSLVDWSLVARHLLQNPLLLIGLLVLCFFLLVGIFADQLATFPPRGPEAQNMTKTLKPPDSINHFGTDRLGRDIFSRWCMARA